MKATFLNHEKPLLVSMHQETNPTDMICAILDARYNGAEAFGIQLESLEREYRTEEVLKKIFSYCGGKPIYITSYRGAQSKGMTDEECVELLLLGLRAGATLCDVIGDLYHPEPDQMTFDPEAVEKQKALIHRIHEMGGEALMSSHLSEFFDEERVMTYAYAQQERGVDIVKIVNKSDSEDEETAHICVIRRMKKELTCPFLYLSGGTHSRLLRQIGPSLGVCMYLCVNRYLPTSTRAQPQLSATRLIRDHLFL